MSQAFASVAAHASLLALDSPLWTNVSASAFIQDASSFTAVRPSSADRVLRRLTFWPWPQQFRLQGVMVLSLSASVAVLLLSAGLLARDLGRPQRLAPFQWIRVTTAEEGRRALVGGSNVWLWGCVFGSSCKGS